MALCLTLAHVPAIVRLICHRIKFWILLLSEVTAKVTTEGNLKVWAILSIFL